MSERDDAARRWAEALERRASDLICACWAADPRRRMPLAVAALEAHAAEAVSAALREALALEDEPARPVSERDESVIRAHAERFGMAVPRQEINQALALLDFERERVRRLEALLLRAVNDSTAREDGFLAGERKGRAEAIEECEEVARLEGNMGGNGLAAAAAIRNMRDVT